MKSQFRARWTRRDRRRCAVVGFAALTSLSSLGEESAPVVPLDYFQAPEGLEITLWASSPMLFNPTNMDVDARGRIWVAEGVNYRSHGNRRPEGDRIVVLEDTDLDGKADSSHVFVQEPFLAAPLGVAVFDNKVVVSMNPSMVVYTDVNENLRFEPEIDKREVLLTGFVNRQHDHTLHSVTAGPDGQWYWNVGNCGATFTDKSGRTFRIGSPYSNQNAAGQLSDDGSVWIGGFSARMNPDGSEVRIIGHNYRNSYEQSITSFGDVFQNDNDDPPACRVTHVLEYGNAGFASADGQRSWQADSRPGQSTQIAEWRQEDPGVMPAGDIYGGGSPTGVAYYENGSLGAQWNGTLLSCEAGRNVVFGYRPKLNGSAFELERFDFLTSNTEREFAGSDFLGGGRSVNYETKTLFRPSDVMVGADGAIYVSDWYDPRVGGHQDLDDTASGAIYRIAPKGFQPKRPNFDLEKRRGQITALRSPAVNVRYSGYHRLRDAGEDAIPAVSKLLEANNRHVRARAIWLLSAMGPKGIEIVESKLNSKNPMIRTVAYRALRRVDHNFLEMASRMAKDPHPAVRREVALSMRDRKLEESLDVLLTLAPQVEAGDRTALEAFGTGAYNKESAVFDALLESFGDDATQWTEAQADIAWRLHPEHSVAHFRARALSSEIDPSQRKRAMDAIAFIPTEDAARTMIELAKNPSFPYRPEAVWWNLHRKNNDWAGFQMDARLKAANIYDADKATITSVAVPDGSKLPSGLPDIETIASMEADADRGKTVAARCYVCHQIDGAGVAFGPELTSFGATQPKEVILQAILDPNADISHGYDGYELTTKDGIKVQGVLVSQSDPVLMKSMGGQIQAIPKNRIENVRRVNRSLMMWPAQLGLTAQDVADVTAYIQALGRE